MSPSSGLTCVGRNESSNFLLAFQREESFLFSDPVRTFGHILDYCGRHPQFLAGERGSSLSLKSVTMRQLTSFQGHVGRLQRCLSLRLKTRSKGLEPALGKWNAG
jgi:hypothetical protein